MYQLTYRFLEYLATVPDVYFVTVQEALEYVKNPVPISELETFKPFGCDHLPRPDGCQYSPSCRFKYHNYILLVCSIEGRKRNEVNSGSLALL